MTYCKISLKEVPRTARRTDYRDGDYKRLFGGLRAGSQLQFTRKEFARDSARYVKGMSISGVQQKLSLKLDKDNNLVPAIEGGEFILKPSPEQFPNAAENEHAAMVLSHLLGINTALCGLVSFKEGELVYITRRFDRVVGGEKLHQEDMAQGFSEQSIGKYDKNYEETGQQIGVLTNGKLAVTLDFVRRVIFAYLIGNDDFHLKNISLQKTEGNTTRFYDHLTPNYDCLFTQAFPNSDRSGPMALDLLREEDDGMFSRSFERFGFYTSVNFIEFANRLGIPERPVAVFVDNIVKSEKRICETINNSYMPEQMKSDARLLVQDRIKALSIKA